MSKPDVVIANAPTAEFAKPEILALRGNVNSVQNYIPIGQNGSATSGFTVNWKAPNSSSLISRLQRIRGTLNFSISWTADATGRDVRTAIFPRQYPLTQLIQTSQSWVNNQNMGGSTFGEYAIQVMKFNAEEIERATPRAPTTPDYWTEYAVARGAVPTNVLGTAIQSIKGRGAYPVVWGGKTVSTDATANTATLSIPFDELLLFGGAYTLDKSQPYLTNVQTLQWAMNFTSNLEKALSFVQLATGSITVGSISVTAGSPALISGGEIVVESFDPNPFFKLPEVAYYGIERYDHQQSQTYTLGATSAGATPTVLDGLTSPVITCPAVPSKMYVFVKPTQLTYDIADSDFVAHITRLQVNMDSKPLFTSYDAQSLALMAQENGFRGYFGDRAHLTGFASDGTNPRGVVSGGLCLVFGKDIVLPPDVVQGSSGQHTLQVICSCVNQSTTAYTVVLNAVLVYDEVLAVSDGKAEIMPVNITPAESTQAGERVSPDALFKKPMGSGLVYRKEGKGASGGGASGGARSGGGQSGGLMARLKK